mmetsp:Transcript_1637/g.2983  ORF Transcript_1637/g.2983 Transcript_1637/m.2983 type:complete len:381 (+) Transcript_1637:74-1216(+)
MITEAVIIATTITLSSLRVAQSTTITITTSLNNPSVGLIKDDMQPTTCDKEHAPTAGATSLFPNDGDIKTPSIILATRIHLGKQSKPPEQSHLTNVLKSFLQTSRCIQAAKSVIAVDPEERIEGYNLVHAIQKALEDARAFLEMETRDDGNGDHIENDAASNRRSCPTCDIIQVTPWGNFIPALNALTMWACKNQIDHGNTVIMFISAETCITKKETVDALTCHMDEDTLVVGAALPGHEYKGPTTEIEEESTNVNNIDTHLSVELNGRTCPWNTLAIWNLNKLALVGFPLVSEGIHQINGKPVAGGIEEVATVLLHQKIHGAIHNRAKLVKVNGVEWEEDFEEDEKRKQWHEEKMKSKYERAEAQRSLLGGLDGIVFHL